MTQSVSLSLPLSATALRLGATLLTDLAAQADVIRREAQGPFVGTAHMAIDGGVPADGTWLLTKGERVTQLKNEIADALAQDVQPTHIAIVETEQADPGCAVEETPEQRQYRLHGNVASAGMEPAPVITQETLPPVEYETVVTGHEPGPVPFADGHNQESYADAGWTVEAMVNAGHLVEVTEQRAKPAAVGASAPPPAPAPAPAAPEPSGSGDSVELDVDGLPWDSRIHSDAAVRKAATGKWKTRKNLAAGYKEQIEAELRAVMNAGKITTTTVAAAAPPAPSAAPAPAPSPAPAAPTAAPTGNAFAEFTRWLVGHTQAKRLTQTDAVLEVQKQGLSQIPDLAKRPDLIPAVMAALTAAKGL